MICLQMSTKCEKRDKQPQKMQISGVSISQFLPGRCFYHLFIIYYLFNYYFNEILFIHGKLAPNKALKVYPPCGVNGGVCIKKCK